MHTYHYYMGFTLIPSHAVTEEARMWYISTYAM